MLISTEWLKNQVALGDLTGQEIGDKMSVSGIEIESVTNIGRSLKKIVIGQTISVVDHPDSDHLHICQVKVDTNDSDESVLQIVCGAPNVAPNQKVIVALPGARIVNNIKIKKGKIRGEVSNGMLCSLEELGFSTNVIPKAYADGIFILPEDAPIGESVIDYLKLDDDILELSITPNRSDALSMYGTAYEVGAIYNQTPVFEQFNAAIDETDVIDRYIQSLSIQNDTIADAYEMMVIKNVTIKESPIWLQSRLMKMGIRPINNVVDVTNYMLLQYGQPLHAFDFEKLQSKDITVRLAYENEVITTLDEKERVLTTDDIVISAGDEAVALAGVMGGLNSEISNETTVVALEIASFNAAMIRETVKRTQLRSEASIRFEKGTHKHLLAHVAQQSAALIAMVSGGTVVAGKKSVNNVTLEQPNINVTAQWINQKLGTQLSIETIYDILVNRLGFSIALNGETLHNSQLSQISVSDELTVIIPPRRFDIRIPSDIVEEVARIYGYDQLPSTLPTTPSIQGGLSEVQSFIRTSRRLLQSLGYSQILSYSLTSQRKATVLSQLNHDPIKLMMPMSEERSTLRQSLLTSMLDVATYNIARNNANLALFEMGRVYEQHDTNPQGREIEHIGIVLTGARTTKSWYGSAEMVDFFDVKGTLDAYFEKIGLLPYIRYEKTTIEALHPGRTANILLDGEIIGFVGQLHPTLAKEMDLKEVFVAEFQVEPLVTRQRGALVQTIVPRYPGMNRDIALLVDESLPHQEIVHIIKQNAGQYLVNIELFDHYNGVGIEPGKKSLAYRLSFLNVEATLVEEEINVAMNTVMTALQQQVSAVIR